MIASGEAELVAAALLEVFPLREALARFAQRLELFDDVEQLKKLIDGQIINEPVSPLYLCHRKKWLQTSNDLFGSPDQGISQDVTFLPPCNVSDSVVLLLGSRKPMLSDNALPDAMPHTITVLAAKNDKASIEERWLTALASLWKAGVNLNWQVLHQTSKRRRVVLPTYPFERKTYRYADSRSARSVSKNELRQGSEERHSERKKTQGKRSLLHNEIHSPSIGKSVFECDLGFESFPYLDNHRVFGQAIVPGSLHISMVLSAARELYPDQVVVIEGLAFGKALFIDEKSDRKLQLVVDSTDSKGGAIAYKLSSCMDDKLRDANAWVVHSQGRMSAVRVAKGEGRFDIDAIKQRCQKRLARDLFYQQWREQGFEWEGDFRSLQSLWQGEGEALALLEHSPDLHHCIDDYSIHPAILDACLQPYLLTIVPGIVQAESDEPYIPLSINRLEFYQRPTKAMWIHVRLRSKESQTADSLAVDMMLLNSQGEQVMSVELLRAIRMPKEQLIAAASELLSDNNDFVYRPIWKPLPITMTLPQPMSSVVIIGHDEDPWQLAEKIATYYQSLTPNVAVWRVTLGCQLRQHSAEHIEIDQRNILDYQALAERITDSSAVYFLGGLARDKDIKDLEQNNADELGVLKRAQESGVFALLYLLQALFNQQRKQLSLKILTHDVYRIGDAGDQLLYPFASGLVGFAKVLSREQANNMGVSCIDFAGKDLSETNIDLIVKAIEEESGNTNLREIAWRNGLRFGRKMLKHSMLETDSVSSVLRHQGVYLIIGGAGGIGVELSLFLAEKYHARVVWVGRRAMSPEVLDNIARVKAAGGEALYLQADATNLGDMQLVRPKIQEKFSTLNGVVHSALLLRDQSIEKMPIDDFREVHDIKARSVVILEQITCHDALDFIAYFSSENALRGWHGLSNYVSGCTFKDNYGYYLKHNRKRPVKVFNWGFWGEVGIAAQAHIRELVLKQGIRPMSTREGLALFDTAINNPSAMQVLATKIDSRINEQLGIDIDFESRQVELIETILPSSLVTISEDVDQAIEQYSANTSNDLWLPKMLIWVQQLSFSLMRDLGVNTEFQQSFNYQQLMQNHSIESKFTPLFAAIEEILFKSQYLDWHDGSLVFTELANKQEERVSIDEIRTLTEQFPEALPWVQLLNTCVEQFIPVVKGEVKATDVLFPSGENTLVENIYRGNCVSDFFNELACETVISFIKQVIAIQAESKNQGKIRILEFGAGTGSTSRVLLSRLKQALPDALTQIEYVYTDVSAHFTSKAQQALASDYPFVKFETFNMEAPPQQQGFELASFDFVFGTNVIHVCADMLPTVQRLKTLLKHNGILMLNELTAINDVWTLTFGLLDGWWLAEDSYLRLPHTPLLGFKSWQQVLGTAGFDNITAFKQPGCTDYDQASQLLIVAQSDGLIEVPIDTDSMITATRPVVEKNQKGPTVTTFDDVISAGSALRYERLAQYLTQKIADTLKIPVNEIPDDKPIGEMGMDSLIVLSFCDDLSREIKQPVPTTMVFDYPTLSMIVKYIAEDILSWESEAISSKIDNLDECFRPEDLVENIASLEGLSDEEIEELLMAELET